LSVGQAINPDDVMVITKTLSVGQAINTDDTMVITKTLSVGQSITTDSNLFVNSILSVGQSITTDDTMVITKTLSVGQSINTDDVMVINKTLSVGQAINADDIMVITKTLSVGQSINTDMNIVIEGSLMIGSGVVYDADYSIQTEKKIKVNSVEVFSDSRMKTNITDVETLECLNKIQQINVKSFNFKNSSTTKKTVGVLAQDVQTIFPDIVSEGFSFLPSIMKTTTALTDSRLVNSINVVGDDVVEINIQDVLLVLDEDGNKFYIKVHGVNDDYIETALGSFEVGKQYNIYGKETSNALSVDYTQLFCYLIGAIQQVSK
jgi:hypothetical protein